MTVHDPAKVSRFARERFSSGLMSDTKWRKLLGAVATAGLPIREMVVKFIDADEPRSMQFPPNLDDVPYAYMDTIEFGPVELRAIEWMTFPADVGAVARALGQFPIEAVGNGTRIVGYRS
jgi:hypothetical protein